MKSLFLSIALIATSMCYAQNAVVLASDVNPGSDNGVPLALTVYNNNLYFYAKPDTFYEFCKYANGVTSIVQDLHPTADCIDVSWTPEMLSYNNKLYIKAKDATHGYELFVYDGTAATLTVDIANGLQSGDPRGFTIFNNNMYFDASDTNSFDYELWKYDPVNNVATQMTDLNPGLNNSHPMEFCVFQGSLFYSGYTPVAGSELRKINPPGAPTLIADLDPGFLSSYPESPIVANGKMFFSATTAATGRELYVYTGTGSPTLISELNPGTGSGVYSDLYLWNDTIYFSGSDGTNGKQLYRLDVASSTISLAATIETGYNSDPENFIVFDGKLYFSAGSTAYGKELWAYDHVSATQVEDINPGANGSSPNYLTTFDNNLFFTAYEPVKGNELYRFGDTTGLSLSVKNIPSLTDIIIAPNPATDEINIRFNSSIATEMNISIINVVGQVVYQNKEQISVNGTHQIKIPVDKLSPGLYNCRIMYNNGSEVYSSMISKQ